MSYHLLYTLPMRCAFKFRKTRAKEKDLNNLPGVMEVLIFSREKPTSEPDGPYSTGIKTTRPVWDNHDKPRALTPNTLDSRGRKVYDPSLDPHAILAAQLADYRDHFQQAQKILLKKKRAINAPFLHELTMQLVQQSRDLDYYREYGEESAIYLEKSAEWKRAIDSLVLTGSVSLSPTLVEVYNEFEKKMGSLINDDQFTRTGDQIALATFRVNQFAWKLLMRYLTHANLVDREIAQYRAVFVEDFKTWARGQTVRKTARKLSPRTVNGSITLLNQLADWAVIKEYLRANPFKAAKYLSSKRGKAQPLSPELLDYLEAAPLPAKLRHVLDSWLVAAELCLHYSDYMRLPQMPIQVFEKTGIPYIHYPRKKQRGTELMITSEFTPRAIRLVQKYGGLAGLYYRDYFDFRHKLKKIVEALELKGADGAPLHIAFGMGRDSGATRRAIEGRPARVLQANLGHANVNMQQKYINADIEMLGEYLESVAGTGGNEGD